MLLCLTIIGLNFKHVRCPYSSTHLKISTLWALGSGVECGRLPKHEVHF